MDWIGDTTGLYFYSAVFQGNMALLALVSVFVIFRLQALNNQITLFDQFTIEYVLNWFRLRLKNQAPPLEALHVDEIHNALTRISEWPESAEYNTPPFARNARDLLADRWLNERTTAYDRLQQQYRRIVRGLILPVAAISCVCLSSIILLTSAEGIHAQCGCTEPVLFTIIIVANVIAVVLTFQYVFRCLRRVDDD